MKSTFYLFDIDGTLMLSGGAGGRALDRAFHSLHGVERAMANVDPAGKTDTLIVEEMFLAHLDRMPTAQEIASLLEVYLPHLRSELQASTRFRLMPAVHEALDYLAGRAEVLLGIATGNIREAAQAKLERADLWHRFALGGFGSDHRDRAALVGRAIERGAELRGEPFDPSSVVVVGDTPRDIAAARACGAVAVAVATGGVGRDELARGEPDALLDTLAELPSWHRAHFDS